MAAFYTADSAFFPIRGIKKECNSLSKIIKLVKWRCERSNPVPLACKASALPFELHPHVDNLQEQVYKSYIIIYNSVKKMLF